MGTKAQIFAGLEPCVSNAHANEPLFILRSTDELSAELVRKWACQYHASKIDGRYPPRSASPEEAQAFAVEQRRRLDKYRSAFCLSAQMDAYRREFFATHHLSLEERIARAEEEARRVRSWWPEA